MTNILEDLWYGRVDPYNECKSCGNEAKQLESYIERHKRSLSETMTDAQKETFEKLLDCYSELSDMTERKIFSQGFKLGMQITIGATCDADKKC